MSAAVANSLDLLLLGGGLGILGQLARALAWWIKSGGPANLRAAGQREAFQASRFFFSLFVGFIAGSAAALLSSDPTGQTALSATAKLCLVAAGYAGTDFIEGIAGRFTATSSAAPSLASRGQANLLAD
jgi:putative chitinase